MQDINQVWSLVPDPKIIWRLLLLLSVFVFPQVLGLLLYFRLVKYSTAFAVITSILITPLVFLYLSPLYFFAGLREAQQRGELNCGMPALGALMMVLMGVAIQLFGVLVVQAFLSCRRR